MPLKTKEDFLLKKKLYLLNPILRASEINKEDKNIVKLNKLGENTGNLVFVNAVKEQMIISEEVWINPDMNIDEKALYIMPCSSFIHEANTWLEPLADIIENQNIKILPIGLGVQADFHTTSDQLVKKLSKRQIAFFKIIAERIESIGVRGEFSAECLNRMGVKNSHVIGCPSVFRYQNSQFIKPMLPSREKILFTVTPSRGMASSKVLKLGMSEKADWILQSAGELEEFFSNNQVIRWLQNIRRFPSMNLNNIIEYQNKKGKIFWSYDEWENNIIENNYSFAFGTRFHGNMMAFRNGIPTVWIGHDMRTKELTEWLHLPYIQTNTDRFKSIENVNDIIKIWEQCSEDFYNAYPDKLKNYNNFLAENGVIE